MANPENILGQGFHTNPERINREGRPKGSRSRQTIVREMLETLHTSGKPIVEVMTASIVNKAIDGDVPAFKELLDSGYGKVADKQEHMGEDGGPMRHKVDVEFVGNKNPNT